MELLDQIKQLSEDYRNDIDELTNTFTDDVQSYLSAVTERTNQYAQDLRNLMPQPVNPPNPSNRRTTV
jgi:ABC-type transporter Mla subunit MlaD